MVLGPIKSAIVAPAATSLSDAERDLFRQHPPFGFILFKRNCVSPDQLRMLVHELCEITQRADTPIFLDQEGGRVSRLKAPVWAEYPAPATYGAMFAEDEAGAVNCAAAAGQLMGEQMRTVGANVNCAPMLDVPGEDSHSGVIGDRAFAGDPHAIIQLGRAYAEGLRSAGVWPVIKHMPGHGRASADSHEELPVVSASRNLLMQTDFATFKALADMPMGMTAHVLYPDIDAIFNATFSPLVIQNIIRQEIGFEGLLMADDLTMKALKGDYTERTEKALDAGNDLVLFNAENDKSVPGRNNIVLTAEVLQAARPLTDATLQRWEKAKSWLQAPAGMAVPRMGYNELMSALGPYLKGPPVKGSDSLVANI